LRVLQSVDLLEALDFAEESPSDKKAAAFAKPDFFAPEPKWLLLIEFETRLPMHLPARCNV